MNIVGVIWLEEVVDKLAWKHRVATEEVEDVLALSPQFRFLERGKVAGEDLYAAFGRSEAGRHLAVFFIHKTTHEALIVSARDTTRNERRTYGRRS